MDVRAFLEKAKDLPRRALDEVIGLGGIVILSPHPDDESLGCGGLIAEASRLGVPCRLIYVTDGAGSHPNSRRYPPHRLRQLREEEALLAAETLGLKKSVVRFLRLVDREVKTVGNAADWTVEKICEAVREVEASALFVTSHLDPHCDHQASYEIAMQVKRLLPSLQVYAYPIWAWRDESLAEVEGEPLGFRLCVVRHLDKKRQAILQHRSQLGDLITDDPFGFRLAPEMIEHFVVPYEIFLEAKGMR